MMAALGILWNHIMKNFQVKHGQCDSIIFLNVGLFQISQKERLFHLLYQPSDNLAM